MGTVKSTALCQRFFSRLRDRGRRCVGLRPTPKIPAVREQNLWYPGYANTFLVRNVSRALVDKSNVQYAGTTL